MLSCLLVNTLYNHILTDMYNANEMTYIHIYIYIYRKIAPNKSRNHALAKIKLLVSFRIILPPWPKKLIIYVSISPPYNFQPPIKNLYCISTN